MAHHAIAFGAAPPAGFELEWGGQRYTVVSAVSFTVRSTPTVSIKWRTTCPDCGKPWTFETGGRRRYLPKRDPVCNGPNDKDSAERKAYARQSWAQGIQRAREAKAGAVVKLDCATLNRLDMLECDAVLANGQRLPIRWAPGGDLSGEPQSIQNAVGLFAEEHKRLMTERLLS